MTVLSFYYCIIKSFTYIMIAFVKQCFESACCCFTRHNHVRDLGELRRRNVGVQCDMTVSDKPHIGNHCTRDILASVSATTSDDSITKTSFAVSSASPSTSNVSSENPSHVSCSRASDNSSLAVSSSHTSDQLCSSEMSSSISTAECGQNTLTDSSVTDNNSKSVVSPRHTSFSDDMDDFVVI